jgi:CBS domain-containing protein
MTVREIMTETPTCCTPDTRLQEVARMMVENDCGAIPVVERTDSKKLVGVITDRDIVCRAVAQGRNPLELKSADCMTRQVVTVAQDADLHECCRLMEEHQIRRIPVVDARGACCGIVAQADIATSGREHEAAELVREVSQPSPSTAAASAR